MAYIAILCIGCSAEHDAHPVEPSQDASVQSIESEPKSPSNSQEQNKASHAEPEISNDKILGVILPLLKRDPVFNSECTWQSSFDGKNFSVKRTFDDGSADDRVYPLDKFNPSRIILKQWDPNSDNWIVKFHTTDGKEVQLNRIGKNKEKSFFFGASDLHDAKQLAAAMRELIKRAGGKAELFEDEHADFVIQSRQRTKKESKSKYAVGDNVGARTGIGFLIDGWRGTVISARGTKYQIKITSRGNESSYVKGRTYDFLESEIEGWVQ